MFIRLAALEPLSLWRVWNVVVFKLINKQRDIPLIYTVPRPGYFLMTSLFPGLCQIYKI